MFRWTDLSSWLSALWQNLPFICGAAGMCWCYSRECCVLWLPPPPKKSPIPLLLKFWFVPTIPHLKAASDTYKQKKLWMHWDLLQRWKGRKKAFLNKVLGKYSRSSSRSICNYMTYVSMWAFQAHSRQCDYKQWDFVFFKCIFCIERFLLAEEIGKLSSSRKISFVSSLVARHDTTWEFYI